MDAVHPKDYSTATAAMLPPLRQCAKVLVSFKFQNFLINHVQLLNELASQIFEGEDTAYISLLISHLL